MTLIAFPSPPSPPINASTAALPPVICESHDRRDPRCDLLIAACLLDIALAQALTITSAIADVAVRTGIEGDLSRMIATLVTVRDKARNLKPL